MAAFTAPAQFGSSLHLIRVVPIVLSYVRAHALTTFSSKTTRWRVSEMVLVSWEFSKAGFAGLEIEGQRVFLVFHTSKSGNASVRVKKILLYGNFREMSDRYSAVLSFSVSFN